MMFKTLRNRLLFTNLIIICILMFVSFGSIYFFTSNNIYEDIRKDLFRIAEFDRSVKAPLPKFDAFGEKVPDGGKEVFDNQNEGFRNERLTGFTIVTDSSFNFISSLSFFDADESFYTAALSLVKKKATSDGRFELDNSQWAYLVQARPNGNVISFMDISTQKSVLDRLILTFSAVSIFMLLAIYYISTFLTDRAIKPIKDAFERQRQFVADASHELKTPLAVIQTNVDLLLDNTSIEDHKWLDYIKTEVNRMSRLTGDLLYLTQVDQSDQMQVLKVPVNLTERLEQLLLGFEVMAYEKAIALNYNLYPDAEIICNAEQISQVLMILLDNALKYTPQNGSIDVSMSMTSPYLIIEVKNTGSGIPEEDLPRIFDRFYRVDPSRSRKDGSYGLGLSIAKTIVDQHGGKLVCDSVVDAYTKFTLKLKR